MNWENLLFTMEENLLNDNIFTSYNQVIILLILHNLLYNGESVY